MAFQFHLPDIGEGVVEGEIVSWKVGEGDRVELDQPLVEVMTDKATVEIPSPKAGVIAKINFQEGEICPVGDVLVVIATEGDSGGDSGGDSDTGGGDSVDADAVAKSGPGTKAASKSSNGASTSPLPMSQQAPATMPSATPTVPPGEGQGRVRATPATRRLARTMGVNLTQVPATGRRGRVTSDDVRRFAQSGSAGHVGLGDGYGPGALANESLDRPSSEPVQTSIPQYAPQYAPIEIAPDTRGGQEERIPLRGMRKRIADNMARSVQTAAHFTYVEEVDMTELVTVRERAKERAAERGIKLSYLPFIIKAVVSSLRKWPQLNAALDESKQEIVHKKYYHIGIAAQGPQGLMVTVVRDADRRSIFDLATEIQRLSQAVQEGTVRRDELSGSTFTITSLGKLGGVLATPIINFPEVGIMGVHKMEQKPAVRDGEIVIRWLMNLSISLDHRLVDGWDGAMFLQDVKHLLEDPTTMFLEMV